MFLKGSALTAYINNYLKFENFHQITEILTNKFIKVSVPYFADFFKFETRKSDLIGRLSNKKTDTDRKMGLYEKLIVRGITDKLKARYQNILDYENCYAKEQSDS